MQVTVVNYGAGNIRSIRNALWRAGGDVTVTNDPYEIMQAERVVLPGVGAAGAAIRELRKLHLDTALDEFRRTARPFFGICVGMQLLAEEMFEFGRHTGLGWLKGTVEPLSVQNDPPVRVPHIGWSEIGIAGDGSTLLGTRARDRFFYFCHSFRLVHTDAIAVATVQHGTEFTSAVQFDNVFASQFHPEKSQLAGERLLGKFLEWRP